MGSVFWEEKFPDYERHIGIGLTQAVSQVPEARNFSNFPHPELSILLTDDAAIRELNRAYRKRDPATNVLAFPSLSAEEIEEYLRQGKMAPDYPMALGDIIFAFETVEREAKEQGKSLSDHFCHLLLHGMLHLLGYDHVEKDAADRMEVLEKKLLAKLSIDDPYQD